MLTIKHDTSLLSAAQIWGEKDINAFIALIRRWADLEDDTLDPYAGEKLSQLWHDQPHTWDVFLEIRDSRRYSSMADLRLILMGAENPCPECGWEVSDREEDHMIICPHCGWSRPMFLSEQNDE